MTVVYIDKDRRTLLLVLGSIVLALGLGILIGHFTISSADSSVQRFLWDILRTFYLYLITFLFSDSEIEETISGVISAVKSENIRSYLQFLTAEPHIAAGPRQGSIDITPLHYNAPLHLHLILSFIH